MKTSIFLVAVAGVGFLGGCATHDSMSVNDPVGPAQSPPANASADSSTGSLVVYSAYQANADFYRPDPYRPEYSDYKIYTTQGKLVQNVHNNTGTILQDPVTVVLTPGEYKVTAHANGYGKVTVPVIIEQGQRTVLHLDGGGSRADMSVYNQTNAVRLPDGRPIGWKASEAADAGDSAANK